MRKYRWKDVGERETGKSPVGARLFDIFEDSDGEAFIRGILVLRDLMEKGDKREGLFAATSPQDMPSKEGLTVMVIAVKKAHLSGAVKP